MDHIFARHSTPNPPTAISGEGCYLFDSNGKRYFDGSGGAAVSCLGHGDKEITEAIKAQLDKMAFAHTGFFTSDPAEQLADLLIQHSPDGIDRVYLVSGGSEATEAAIKLARQYHAERSEPSGACLAEACREHAERTMPSKGMPSGPCRTGPENTYRRSRG